MRAWRLQITKTDGATAEYTITPRTIVAFERHFKVGLAAAFQNEQKMEHLYWLGWDAERLAGNTVPVFETWLESVSAVDLAVEAGFLDATA